MQVKADFAANRRLLRISALAIAIGALCGVIALILLKLIALFTNLFFHLRFSFAPAEPTTSVLGVWTILVPVAGGLIIGVMAYFGSEKIRGHGIPEALESILFGRSRMDPKVAVLKPLSSAISIGSGGPFGAEGPIIMTGGAFGSLVAQAFNLTSAERKTLLVAGAAAGMSATFATPVAAALLAVELLLFEWKPRSLVPVALASAVAAALRPLLLGTGPLFPAPGHAPLQAAGLLMAILAGGLAGVVAWLLTSAVYGWEDLFHKLPIHWAWWPAIGGLLVGIGGYFEPRAMGVGYSVIGDLLAGRLLLAAVLALIVVKGLIWSAALGSGTSGGVLAPLLMVGAALGAVLSQVLPAGAPEVWPLVCMAAVMAGVMRAPFTAIVFAFELTHDVNALPPLLIACTVAYLVSVLWLKRSILTEKIARRGYHILCEYSVDPLERVYVEDVMTRDVATVPAALPVRELIQQYFGGRQQYRGYPVVDGGGRLLGIVTQDDLIEYTSGGEPPELPVGEVVARDQPVAYPHELCREVAARMVRHKLERLPVLASEAAGELVGIVTRSDLLKPASQYYEQEELRERIKWWSGKPAA
jgi:H+/Cl- antiporter ClcA/CBS domain-containing protein